MAGGHLTSVTVGAGVDGSARPLRVLALVEPGGRAAAALGAVAAEWPAEFVVVGPARTASSLAGTFDVCVVEAAAGDLGGEAAPGEPTAADVDCPLILVVPADSPPSPPDPRVRAVLGPADLAPRTLRWAIRAAAGPFPVSAPPRACRGLEPAVREFAVEMVEAIGAGLTVADAEGRFEYVNPSFAAMLGMTRESLVGRSVLDIVAPDGLATVYASFRARQRGETSRFEVRLRHAEGGFVDALVTAVPCGLGRRFASVAVVTDLSEQRAAERALRESEVRYRLLAETGEDVVSLHDEAGRYLYVSPSAKRMGGYDAEDLIGESAYSLIHPDDRAHVRVEAKRPITDRRATVEFRQRRKDGTYVWAEARITPVAFADDWPIRSLCVTRDISARREAEMARQEANQALEALVRAAPLPIVELDTAGRVMLWNPAAEATFGWRQDEVVGRPSPIVPESERAVYAARLDRQWAGEFEGDYEGVRVTKDGRRLQVQVSVAPLRDAEGRVRGSVGIVADVTARKQLEDQLRQAQKMEAVGRLAGGVAHDFNNLLGVIIGYADLLVQDRPPGDPAAALAREIAQAAERGAGLTRQLLAFTRKQITAPEPVNLNEVINGVAQMLRRLLGPPITLTTRLAPALPLVRADRSQLEQVLVNLAVNARDAMAGGGCLTIETSEAATANGDCVRLIVTDTGEGMDEETRRRAFEPFFTTKEPGKGTGLGLSTVYAIVEQNGGRIDVETGPGQGAAFTIDLPRLAAAPTTDQAPPVATGVPLGTETILVVEDEPALRRLAAASLGGLGYRVLEAGEAEAALAAAADPSAGIQLLLTDIVMPGISGLELARRIRAMRPELPVLFVSGYAGDEAADLDGAGFLQKPFSPRMLARRVRDELDRRAAAAD